MPQSVHAKIRLVRSISLSRTRFAADSRGRNSSVSPVLVQIVAQAGPVESARRTVAVAGSRCASDNGTMPRRLWISRSVRGTRTASRPVDPTAAWQTTSPVSPTTPRGPARRTRTSSPGFPSIVRSTSSPFSSNVTVSAIWADTARHETPIAPAISQIPKSHVRPVAASRKSVRGADHPPTAPSLGPAVTPASPATPSPSASLTPAGAGRPSSPRSSRGRRSGGLPCRSRSPSGRRRASGRPATGCPS